MSWGSWWWRTSRSVAATKDENIWEYLHIYGEKNKIITGFISGNSFLLLSHILDFQIKVVFYSDFNQIWHVNTGFVVEKCETSLCSSELILHNLKSSVLIWFWSWDLTVLPLRRPPSGWELFCRPTTWSPASSPGSPPRSHTAARGSPGTLAPCCRTGRSCTGTGSTSDLLLTPGTRSSIKGHLVKSKSVQFLWSIF